MARKPRRPAETQPPVTLPPHPIGWLRRSDDGDQIRAVHDASAARRLMAMTGSTFVPRPPPQHQPPTGRIAHPEDNALVARTGADREGIQVTMRGLSRASSGNYGKKETEPTAAGQPVTFVNGGGGPVMFGAEATFHGQGTAAFHGQEIVAAKSAARPKKAATQKRRLVIGDKRQVVQYSNIIIVALQEALDYDRARHHNQQPPALYIDDDKYKSDIRELIVELRRLNDLLERKSLRSVKKPAINLAKHLDTFLGTYAKTYAKGMGWGMSGLTIGAIATLLYHLGLHDVAGEIFRHLKGCR
jgi:hypothetical protein